MDYLLLGISVFTGSFKSIVNKRVKRGAVGMGKTMQVNAISFAVAFVVVFLFAVLSPSFSFTTPVLLAVLNAGFILLSQVSLMKAVDTGSVTISSLFYSCGFIIPTVFGAIYYGEKVHFLQIIGIAVILVSFILCVEKENGKKFNFKWFIYALGGTVFSGLLGVVQKIFGVEYRGSYSLDTFLSISFLMIIGISLIVWLIYALIHRSKTHDHVPVGEKAISKIEKATIGKRTFVFTLVLGLILGFHNKICTYLSGVLPSALYFPIVNGGVIVMTAIISSLILREKLSKRQLISVILGFVAIGLITVGKVLLGG